LISLCHPTIRADKWLNSCRDFFDKCDDPDAVEYVLAVEPDLAVSDFIEKSPFSNTLISVNRSGPSLVNGFNAAAAASSGNPIIFMADDLWGFHHWDTALLEVIGDRLDTEAVVWSRNGSFWGRECGEEVHPILTRKYYERYGYVLNPVYRAHYADTEFAAVARLDGVLIDGRDRLPFDHRHYSEGKAQRTESNARDEANHAEAERIFNERKAAGFPREDFRCSH
jgi:hypothetical protein